MFVMVAVLVVLVIGLTACAKQPVVPAPEPEMKVVIEPNAWAIFDRMPSKIDTERAKILGLREIILTTPLRVFNCMNVKKNEWRPEILPVGTVVLIDLDGIPVFKRDCGNKLFVEITTETPKTVFSIPAPIKKGFWAGPWNILWDILKWLLIILGIILLLLLLFCLVRGIARAVRWLLERFERREEGGSTTLSTTAPVIPPVPAPAMAPTPRLRQTPASAPVVPAATTARPTATSHRACWMIHAEEGTDHRTHVNYEGFKSFRFDTEGDEVKIKASRR